MADTTAAKARLRILTDATGRVPLTDEELELCLADAAVVDADGRTVDDPAWAGAWDWNYAAGRGWDLKAGKVAGDFSFSADDASYTKDVVMAKCLQMAQTYYGRTLRTQPLDGDRSFSTYPMSPALVPNWNPGGGL